jgi:hypothetical protein
MGHVCNVACKDRHVAKVPDALESLEGDIASNATTKDTKNTKKKHLAKKGKGPGGASSRPGLVGAGIGRTGAIVRAYAFGGVEATAGNGSGLAAAGFCPCSVL